MRPGKKKIIIIKQTKKNTQSEKLSHEDTKIKRYKNTLKGTENKTTLKKNITRQSEMLNTELFYKIRCVMA